MGPDERDCAALLHLLTALPFAKGDEWSSEARQGAIGVMWTDLLSRLKRHAPSARESERWPVVSILRDAADRRKYPGVQSEPSSDPAVTDQQREVDVLVMCPLAKELNPSLVAFGLEPSADEHVNLDGHKVYYVEVPRGTRPTLSVAISVVTKPRNVSCALTTARLITLLKPEAVFLSGIGGGVKAKMSLGDVIISTKIIDIAGGRAEVGRVSPRDEPYVPPNPIARQSTYFTVRPAIWSETVKEYVERLRTFDQFKLPEAGDIGAASLRIEQGAMVVGEQLIADGSLPEVARHRDDRIRSCDMEGSGFAQACEDARKQWLAFRGISDFGDPDKDDAWQAFAAIVAALAVRSFLITEFRLMREVRFS